MSSNESGKVQVMGKAGASTWQAQGPIRRPTLPPATTFQTSSEL